MIVGIIVFDPTNRQARGTLIFRIHNDVLKFYSFKN
jgi:hypothetical protein